MGDEEGEWNRTPVGVFATFEELAVVLFIVLHSEPVVEADGDDLWSLIGWQSSWDVCAGTATVRQLAVCFHTGLGRGGSNWGEGQEEEEGGEEQREAHLSWTISLALFCQPGTINYDDFPLPG